MNKAKETVIKTIEKDEYNISIDVSAITLFRFINSHYLSALVQITELLKDKTISDGEKIRKIKRILKPTNLIYKK